MDNNINKNDYEKTIAGYIGNLLRNNFGKGPKSIYVTIAGKFICIHARNFMSPFEVILQEQDQDQTIDLVRNKLFSYLLPEIKQYIEVITGNSIEEFYYDWSLHNKSVIFVGIAVDPFNHDESINREYKGKKDIEEEIDKLSYYAQKTPENTCSFELKNKTIIIIRTGILIRFEKALIRKGKENLVKSIKREMEKNYLHNSVNYERILGSKVIDGFIDWDFNLDKSVIVIIKK